MPGPGPGTTSRALLALFAATSLTATLATHAGASIIGGGGVSSAAILATGTMAFSAAG